ncbi:hypothetical protein LK07_15455 [Streptomyces pluripotens]|uniref:Uncharacterized protein n=1 Tax=Streptomyces pluripotens TaxID=1355015 RepID=A0A221NYW3_9ACTN|nr:MULTISPECIES: hypothetical protein [Streptomyces]ARP70934.1 hypothetical protein LK06_014320 [Streptomyces pluripotens]ASN25189.1 hypothetical protein LK07_15455 [Streptomyces pluripotens]KIE27637.1 hypothetical protein LK08_06995 [Streptomyces sp. MUSC 125]MCH0559720.1 hypothetical protein [Streptomyces sp. MUM 16J]
MAPSPDDFDQNVSSAGSPGARDRGLRRGRHVTRWIAVTAVAGAAALGGYYTQALPGGSASPAPAGPQSTQQPATSATGGDDAEHGGGNGHEEGGDDGEGTGSAAQPAPQPPAQPPAPTQQQPHTTTGAS